MTTDTRTQHTPGPWQWFADVEEQRVELWGVNADVQEDDPIVAAHATDLIAADRDPNLRLIAAAPDLLAALELARQALVNLQAEGESRYMPIVRQADAAIRKARGEE